MITLEDIYPIGSYYETSDTEFSPADSWGGIWELQRSDSVLISEGEGFIAGEEGGENQVVLVEQNLPNHRHQCSMVGTKPGWSTGWMGDVNITSVWNKVINNASASQQYGYGYTTFSNAGDNKPHNNMQPYINIRRWKRVA